MRLKRKGKMTEERCTLHKKKAACLQADLVFIPLLNYHSVKSVARISLNNMTAASARVAMAAGLKLPV